jgi:hypothetical protein
MNLKQLEALFVEQRLKYQRESDHIMTGFATRRYRHEDGRMGVALAVRLSEDGEILEFIAPALYNSRRCRHPAALFQVLLDITMRTKLIRFEHDPSDGEIRCTIDFPLQGGAVTSRQFRQMLDCLVDTVDRWAPAIGRAMEAGSLELLADEVEVPAAAGERPG